ncbi:MAG: amidohydrolase family protein [Novosphingobium sp.]|nr:amidohydrolase family protein [Novosphingobium sp.]
MSGLAIPESVRPFAGRIIDADSHEMIPAQMWHDEFGAITDRLAKTFLAHPPDNPGGLNYPDFAGDVMAMNADTVWTAKGSPAPGAVDFERRLELMDFTGVDRQLVFPGGVAIMASFLYNFPVEYGFMQDFDGDRKVYGRQLIDASNQWAVRTASISSRLRPIAALIGDTPEELIASARSLIEQGIRTVWLMSSVPPGGVSPAHSSLDPLWSLLADAQITATLHIGSEGGFLKSEVWGDAESFDGYKVGVEFDLSPWRLSIQHLPSQNFLATMITGGVFERHPGLRFGVIELGSFWIGPLAQMLDLWHDNGETFGPNAAVRLSMRPSEYIARNVRVTAFPFEPVDDYIDKFGLEDVYCYASDFPHLEGGKHSMHRFAARLERLGPAIMEKFFVTNGSWLVPA